MILHAYIMCWNEEKILAKTLDYYSKYCDKIILMDNMSTDKSLEIAKTYPKVEIMQFDTGGKISEIVYLQLKTECYKYSRGKADWVIVCDCDEIVYGLDSLAILNPEKDVPYLEGYQMMVNSFEEFDKAKQILDIRKGFRDEVFDKVVLFNPNVNIQWGFGCHNSNIIPTTNKAHCKLLHYKYLGRDYIKWKNARSKARLSEFNKSRKLGDHYNVTDLEVDQMFYKYLPKLIEVI